MYVIKTTIHKGGEEEREVLLPRPLFKVKAKIMYLLLCHYAEQGPRRDNGCLRVRKQEGEGREMAKRRVKLTKL